MQRLSILLCLSLIVPGLLCAQPATATGKTVLTFGSPVPKGSVGIIDGELVSKTELYDELATVKLRPTGDGQGILDAIIDSELVDQESRRRGLEVRSDEVDASIRSIDNRLRAMDKSKSLEGELKKANVPMSVFREKMRFTVALEKLCRADIQVPATQPVSPTHQKTWLSNARSGAKILRWPQALPPHTVAKVNDEYISSERIGKELILLSKPKEVAKLVENLLQEKLVRLLLRKRKHQLGEADFLQEWDYRKRKFAKNPRYKGIVYEDMIKQTTGLDAQTLRSTLGFRFNTAVGWLAHNAFSQQQVKEAYERYHDRFGPRLYTSHILVACTDDPKRKNQGQPSIAKGLERIQHIRAELNKGLRFSELAATWSADKATKSKGGQLPMFTPGQKLFEESLVKGAAKLQVGQVSEPIKTASGWHLVRLDRKEPAPPISNPEVNESLRRMLAANLTTEAYKAATLGIDIRGL